MLNVLARRFPGLHVRLFPAQVQGEGAVDAVCRGIRFFSQSGWAEIVIVARGGGSLEDLWTFNEEEVARAIASCSIPVVSAIGHETDFTIADFAADLRAPTPSAAAELVVCTREQLLEQIGGRRKALGQALRYSLSMAAKRLHTQGIDRATTTIHRSIGRAFQRVDELERRLRKMDLRLRFSGTRRRLDALHNREQAAITLRLSTARRRLDMLAGELNQLSPLRILERGYAIVHDHTGSVVKDVAEVSAGEELTIRLAKGILTAEARGSKSG
jgi:exodeoxyribonuclease VII large subunit